MIKLFFGKSLIAPSYWGGLVIVPIVLLAYAFLGISNNFVAGIYIEKQTKRLPIVTFAAAGVNVIANLLLIPRLQIMGAAIATLLSYSAMAVGTYLIGQRAYRMQYEWGRLTKVALATLLVYIAFIFVKPESFVVVWKVGLVALFFVMIYLMKFFRAGEIAALVSLLSKRPSKTTTEEVPPNVET